MEKINTYLKSIKGYWFLVIFTIGAFILYGNTISHTYALDDSIVITKNEFTKQGLKGIPDILTNDSFLGFFGKNKSLVQGGRYRPFSLITFAVEYQLFGENPHISHIVNILLYGLLSCLVFLVVLKLLFILRVNNYLHLTAFATAALFLIHPAHTEVVANIKGRDEILSLMFSLLAFLVLLKKRNAILKTLLAILFIFIASMSKENSVAFLAIIPLFLFLKDKKISLNVIIATSALATGVALFLILRHNAVGAFKTPIASELMNNPFLNASQEQKLATLFFTWLLYFKLLIFPHPLTYDYYPYHIQIQNFGNFWVGISIIVMLLLFASLIFTYKKRPLLFFSNIGFMLAFLPVSNLIFPVGTFMNERFMFMPSFFYCTAIVVLFIPAFAKMSSKYSSKVISILIVLVFIGYSAKSITRNRAWKNDFTLFTTDVLTSANSAKSNCSAGGKLWEAAKIEKNESTRKKYYSLAEKYLTRSVEIYPQYVDAWLLLGNVKFDKYSNIAEACNCYLKVLQYQPANSNAWSNIHTVLQASNNRQMQLEYYQMLEKINPADYTTNYKLGVLYGRYFQNIDTGIKYLEKATSLNPNSSEALKDLGTSYGMQGNLQKAYNSFIKAIQIDSTDSQLYYNVGVALHQMGKYSEAEQYMLKSKQLENK